MDENLRDLWPNLALDGVGDLLVDARPGFVVDAAARRPIFANAAGRRFLGLGPQSDLDDRASLDPRLGERLALFAERADGGAATRELLRVRDGLKTSLIALAFRRPVAGGPIVVVVETAVPDAADARPEANLAPLARAGAMVALFDGHGDVIAAQGDHGAVDGLDEDLERILDEAETHAVVERDLAVADGRRTVALVTLGSAPDARRLLWIGPMVAAAEEPRIEAPVTAVEEAPASAATEERPETIDADAPAMRRDEPVTTAPEIAPDEAFIDDAPFVAAAPLAFDAWDDDTEADDAAWIAHAAAPEPAIAPEIETISEAAAAAVTVPPIDRDGPPLDGSSAPAETQALVAVSPEADPADDDTTDGFRFVPPGHAVKFVWLMDAERRFTLISPELEQIVGSAVTRLVGRSWSEIAGELGFDGDGIIAEALARRDTWSGRTVLWPVEGEALRVPVDLAALPAFDRGRIFAGFRGFGTCRADEPVPDPTGIGLRLRTHSEPGARAIAALPAPSLAPHHDEIAFHPEADDDEAIEAAWIDAASPVAPEAIAPETIAPELDVTPESSTATTSDDDARIDDEVSAETGTAPEPTTALHAIEIPATPVVDTAPPASSAEAATPTPAAPAPAAPRIGVRTVADTAAIAAAVAAFTAAGAPKTGPARADATLGTPAPMVPAKPSAATIETPTGVQPPADRTAPDAASDNARLSQPERVAFRQIAEALGARVEAEPEPDPAATNSEPVTETARPTETLAETAAPDETVAVTTPPVEAVPAAPAEPAAPAAATAQPSPRPVDPRLLDRLPLAVAVIKDDAVAYANERFLDLLRYPDVATLEAAGGLDSLFAGEHVARRWDGGGAGRPMPLIARDGTLVPADANISPIPWADGSALMMTLTEVAPVPAVPAPAAVSLPPTEIEATKAQAAVPMAADGPSNIVALPTPALSVVATGPSSEAARIAELEAIVDTATDGVLVLDADGIVLSANAAAEALFGTERRVMIGRPLGERLAPESRRSAMDYLDGLARNGVASVLNDGREVIGAVQPEGLIPLFMTIGNISSGPDKKYCVVLRDIAQWKKAEEDLTTARRRAEEASIHKSDFLAKISHEIRTPLNAIIGFSELMIDERFGLIGNDRYKDYLRDIHVSGTHIMSLVNDLLDLSKVEAGKMDLRFEAVSLADVVSECVAMMQPQANRERIIIRSSLPVGVPPVVADPRSVRQVVLNLLSNAIKFTPAGGQVIVSTTLEDNGEVVMRVRDTGYGMTDKEMQTAMEPFRQLHTTRSRGGGTGLGLPLTKALVEANRAVFRIDSTVGQGTLVSIAFPVTRVLAS